MSAGKKEGKSWHLSRDGLSSALGCNFLPPYDPRPKKQAPPTVARIIMKRPKTRKTSTMHPDKGDGEFLDYFSSFSAIFRIFLNVFIDVFFKKNCPISNEI